MFTVVCTVCEMIYLNCCGHKVIIWWKSQCRKHKHSHTREVRVPWVKLRSERKQRGDLVEHLPFGVISTEFSEGASPETGATFSEYVTDIAEECKCLFQSMKRQQHKQTQTYAEGQETIQHTHSQTLTCIYRYKSHYIHKNTQWTSLNYKIQAKNFCLSFRKSTVRKEENGEFTKTFLFWRVKENEMISEA